jgi:hypothetical protein
MHDTVTGSTRKMVAVLVTLILGLAACSGVASSAAPGADTGGGGASAAAGGGGAAASTDTSGGAAGAGASTDTSGGAAGGNPAGEGTATGSLVSSGLYDATWTWQPGNAVDVGIGGTTLNSDKGTFGSISVLADGSITFTSGAPELHSGSYSGTGAQVHMQEAGGVQVPCGWTLDNDVTGSDGVIHLKGTMDVHGTIWECP